MSREISMKSNSMSPSRLAFLYVILAVVTCFSLLYGWVPVLHSQAYIAILAILSTFLIASKYFTTSQFFITLFYGIVVWLNAKWGDEYAFDKEVMDGLMLGMCGSISYYLMTSDDQKTKKWISILILSVLIIQTVPSLIMYMTAKDTIRTFMNMVSHGEADFEWEYLFKVGILSYDVTHSLPVLVPPLMMWLRTKDIGKTWKTFCLISLLCILVLTFIYDVTTVQILVFFCIGVSLLIYPNQAKRNRQRVILVSLLILPIVVSTSLQVGLLKRVETVAPGEMKEKVADMQYNLTHNDDTGDIGNRSKKYTLSLLSFIDSPIVGTDDVEQIGYHSAVFDRLGAFGLIGFVPFLLILILTTRFCRKRMSTSSRWYYLVCTIAFVILLIMKNMCRVEEWLMYLVVAPSLLTLSFDTVGVRRKN